MKKFGLLLSVFVLGILLVGCSGNSGSNEAMDNYLNDNEEILLDIFNTLDIGEVTLSVSDGTELVGSIEMTHDLYEIVEAALGSVEENSVGEMVERYIVESHSGIMRELATMIAIDTELGEASVRIIVTFEGEELVNLAFDSHEIGEVEGVATETE